MEGNDLGTRELTAHQKQKSMTVINRQLVQRVTLRSFHFLCSLRCFEMRGHLQTTAATGRAKKKKKADHENFSQKTYPNTVSDEKQKP